MHFVKSHDYLLMSSSLNNIWTDVWFFHETSTELIIHSEINTNSFTDHLFHNTKKKYKKNQLQHIFPDPSLKRLQQERNS